MQKIRKELAVRQLARSSYNKGNQTSEQERNCKGYSRKLAGGKQEQPRKPAASLCFHIRLDNACSVVGNVWITLAFPTRTSMGSQQFRILSTAKLDGALPTCCVKMSKLNGVSGAAGSLSSRWPSICLGWKIRPFGLGLLPQMNQFGLGRRDQARPCQPRRFGAAEFVPERGVAGI